MRFDAKTRTLSVYDVYHEVKPDVPTDNIGHNLRRSKLPDKTAKFGAFITPDRCVSLPQVHGSAPRRNGKPTPALRSRDELDRFLVLLSGGLKGPDVSLFSQRVDNFHNVHGFFIDELWPRISSIQTTEPSPLLRPQDDSRRPTTSPYVIPSPTAIQKIEESLNLSFERTPINGVYKITCTTEIVPTLVHTVGMYTHSHWVNKSHKVVEKVKPNALERLRLRFKCYRDSNGKKSHHGATTT